MVSKTEPLPSNGKQKIQSTNEVVINAIKNTHMKFSKRIKGVKLRFRVTREDVFEEVSLKLRVQG